MCSDAAYASRPFFISIGIYGIICPSFSMNTGSVQYDGDGDCDGDGVDCIFFDSVRLDKLINYWH